MSTINKIPFHTRLKSIMSERNLESYDVLVLSKCLYNKLHISLTAKEFSKYLSGATPTKEHLQLLARLFRVNEFWLLGFDVNQEYISTSEQSEVIVNELLGAMKSLENTLSQLPSPCHQ